MVEPAYASSLNRSFSRVSKVLAVVNLSRKQFLSSPLDGGLISRAPKGPYGRAPKGPLLNSRACFRILISRAP